VVVLEEWVLLVSPRSLKVSMDEHFGVLERFGGRFDSGVSRR